MDKSEVDAIYIVGGDGTLSAVLTGLFTKDDTTVPIPVGIFPGGQNNRSLEQLMPSTFERIALRFSNSLCFMLFYTIQIKYLHSINTYAYYTNTKVNLLNKDQNIIKIQA